jgi:hypothetical protein
LTSSRTSELELDFRKELCMQCNPSKFYVNVLPWQILETQNLGCYKPTSLKRNLTLEIHMRSEMTQGIQL